MSRSYRKPVVKLSHKHTKLHKRLANRRVRQKLKEEETSTQYKKLTDSYDITDCKKFATGEEFRIKASRK